MVMRLKEMFGTTSSVLSGGMQQYTMQGNAYYFLVKGGCEDTNEYLGRRKRVLVFPQLCSLFP